MIRLYIRAFLLQCVYSEYIKKYKCKKKISQIVFGFKSKCIILHDRTHICSVSPGRTEDPANLSRGAFGWK